MEVDEGTDGTEDPALLTFVTLVDDLPAPPERLRPGAREALASNNAAAMLDGGALGTPGERTLPTPGFWPWLVIWE